MYLSLLRLNPASAIVQRDLRDVTELHCTIMKAYPDISDCDVQARAHFGVLYRLEFERSTGRIKMYVQSKVVPDWLRLPKNYLCLEGEMPNPAVKPVGEIYDQLKEGQILRFRLRANPTRKIDTKSGPNGERRNGRRVPIAKITDQIEWLARKAVMHGFILQQVSVAACGATELVYGCRGERTFQGVVYEGTLVVADIERFQKTLKNGIGSGKAFGFGLLSIAPQ